MAIDPDAASGAEDADSFRQFIIWNVEYVLRMVQNSDAALSADVRQQALHTLDYACKWPPAWPATRALLLAMAPKMEQAGFREEWIPYLEKGIALSQQQGDFVAEAALQFHLGVLYQLRSKYETARQCFTRSAGQYAALGDTQNQAKAFNRLAYVARLQRRYAEATAFLQKAFTLLDDANPEHAYAYFVRGTLAYDEQDWQRAADYFQQAIERWQQVGNQRMIAWNLTNLGTALRPLQRYAEAIRCYEEAIAIFGQIHDPVHQAVAQMNIGNVYLSLEQPQQALPYFEPAAHVFQQTRDELRLAMVSNNLGLAHSALQQWDEAERFFRTSMQHWQQVGNLAALIEVMCELGLMYWQQGETENALPILESAQKQLADIENTPGFTALSQMVTEALEKVQSQNNAGI